MKLIITNLILILSVQLCFGQIATISDKDGWTYLRSEPNINSSVLLKVYENEVFWYEPTVNTETEWVRIHVPKNKFCLGTKKMDNIVGFIHQSRLKRIEELNKPDSNEISFTYLLSKFDTNNRVIDKEDNKWITQIDGRPVWGTDGGLPKVQVDSINLAIKGKTHVVNRVLFNDLFECTNKFKIFKNKGTYFIYQWNSDGAGFYEIVWVINEQGVVQRLVGSII